MPSVSWWHALFQPVADAIVGALPALLGPALTILAIVVGVAWAMHGPTKPIDFGSGHRG